MGDVKALTERLLILNRGKLIYNGGLNEIAKELAGFRLLRATFEEPVDSAALCRLGRVVSKGGLSLTLEVPFGEITRIASALIAGFPVQDFTIEEVSLEDVLNQVFANIP